MKIHHFGYAVKDLEKSMQIFSKLGFEKIGGVVEDEERKVKIIFVENRGTILEIIAPLQKGSPIDNLLTKNGPTIYHICYEVEDIKKSCMDLKKAGWFIVQESSIAPAINSIGNAKVAFLYNKDIGLIEIVENKINGGIVISGFDK